MRFVCACFCIATISLWHPLIEPLPFLLSGRAAYRLRRTNNPDEQINLFFEAFDEPRYDLWELPSEWLGTTVAVEIRTDRIADFQGFFQWIRRQMPARRTISKKIRFTP